MNEIIQFSQIISALIVIIGAFITIVGFFTKSGRAIIQKYFFGPIFTKIETIDINQCKSYLTDFLAEVESGKQKTENQIKRAYEVYEHYCNDLHQNSYVHAKWEELQRKGLI